MLTEDYIMRMIGLAVAALMQALGLKKSGKFNQALQAFDQAIEHLLGLSAHLALQMEDALLLDRLTFQGRLDIERLLVLADIYREQAEVFDLRGQSQSGRFASQRSLRLYLEAFLAGDTRSSPELIQKIEMLRQKFPTSAMPVETQLALMDYLDRLLATDNAFLATISLSRLELQSAFSSLQRAGL